MWNLLLKSILICGLHSLFFLFQIKLVHSGLWGHLLLILQSSFSFPGKFEKMALLNQKDVEKYTILFTNGERVTVSGRFRMYIQDNRQFKHETFGIRLFAKMPLKIEVKREAQRTIPVSLLESANRSFRDEIADDRQGGWTDQGSGNDLRMLPPGKHLYNGRFTNTSDICLTVDGKMSAILLSIL